MRLALIAAICVSFAMGAACQSKVSLASRDERYKLQPSDVLEVEYVYTPEYNQVVTVGPDGFVNLKLLGGVKVGDLTLDEATASITAKASVPLNKPELTLTLKEYVKPHFTVSGQIEHPGIYDMHGSVTMLQAIAMSGGLKEFAQQKQVLLVRKTNDEFAEVRVVDIKKLGTFEGAREDFNLKPGDMILVPKDKIGKVEPYIRVAAMGLTSLYGVEVFR